MGPVRQNPIQRTVSLFICVCIALCTIVAQNIAQNRPDSFPPYPPDNHHSSDDVYLREGGSSPAYNVMNTFGDRQWKCVDSRWYMSHKLVYRHSLSIQVQWQPSPWLSIRWIRSIIYPATPPVEAAPVVTYLRFQFRYAARAAPVRWPCHPCNATAPVPCSAHFDHAHFHHSPKTSWFSYSIDFEVDWPQ